MSIAGVLQALAAAVLFGLSTPLAKRLVGTIDPWMLAACFYIGSGLGLAAVRRALVPRRRRAEAPLTRADMPWLAGAILCGGVAGPVLLMVGLQRTAAAATSLLLTLEGVATALLAWFLFRENFDRRVALGMGLLVLGAAVLAWQGSFSLSGLAGPAAIAGACAAWGLDNNLTRKVSLADPVQIAMLKGLVAGPVTLTLALLVGAPPPAPVSAVLAAVVGFFGYGVSLVLFVGALRHLGTARTGAYYSIAPFVGAAAAIPLVGEPPTVRLGLAGALMAAGVWLHLTEHHEHEHEHAPMEHQHRHVHDAHHRHAHAPGDAAGEPHSHRHVHVRQRHSHRHLPDSHHTHGH